MEKLVGWYRSQSVGGLTPKIEGFGDWLQPYAKTNEGDTAQSFLGCAYYAHSAQLLANAARVLNRKADAQHYAAEADTVRKAFSKHYFDADGKLTNAPETQTAYVLAIGFDLIFSCHKNPGRAVDGRCPRLDGSAEGQGKRGSFYLNC